MIYHVNNRDLTMYADDHQLYKSGTDYCEVKDSLEKEGQRAVTWYKDNYLLSNPDKFQALTINPCNLNMPAAGVLINKAIKITDYIKLLEHLLMKT